MFCFAFYPIPVMLAQKSITISPILRLDFNRFVNAKSVSCQECKTLDSPTHCLSSFLAVKRNSAMTVCVLYITLSRIPTWHWGPRAPARRCTHADMSTSKPKHRLRQPMTILWKWGRRLVQWKIYAFHYFFRNVRNGQFMLTGIFCKRLILSGAPVIEFIFVSNLYL